MKRARRYLVAISAVALLVGTKSIVALTSTAPGLGTASSFAVLAGSTVTSTGNTACNVFWQVGSSATLDTTTTFVGTIMALASITMNDGASIDGRALAQTAAVTVVGVPNGGGGGPQGGPRPQGGTVPWIPALVAGVLASAGCVGAGLTIHGRRSK